MMEISVFKIGLIVSLVWLIAAAIKFLFFSEQSDIEAQRTVVIEELPEAVKTKNPLSAYLGKAKPG